MQCVIEKLKGVEQTQNSHKLPSENKWCLFLAVQVGEVVQE